MSFGTGQLTFSATGTPEQLSTTSIKVARLVLQQVATNSNPVEFGASGFTFGQGRRLIAPAASVPLDEREIRTLNDGGNTIDLSQIYVAGTSGEKVNYFYEQF